MFNSVFNYWEPLHYLDRGYGFQTWETSPVYAIRSYAYILVHLLPAKIPSWILGAEKVSYIKHELALHTLNEVESYILCSSYSPWRHFYVMRS